MEVEWGRKTMGKRKAENCGVPYFRSFGFRYCILNIVTGFDSLQVIFYYVCRQIRSTIRLNVMDGGSGKFRVVARFFGWLLDDLLPCGGCVWRDWGPQPSVTFSGELWR
uniref:(northern house mosquito) hypothetical protein n=1 Tax=Culex pipiens TaxID=7175 RepID=A0A8D8CCT7_CULPI